jgi:UDP-glucose 4-epimerase
MPRRNPRPACAGSRQALPAEAEPEHPGRDGRSQCAQTVLATGGAGYIGSHVAAALLAAKHRVVILDDFSNSHPEVIDRINAIGPGRAALVRGDVRDEALLDDLFATHRIDAVVHLAGLKAVGESVEKPLLYQRVNVGGAIALFEAMLRHRVMRLVFSSSATVYGQPERVPVTEEARLGATSPYGRTKLAIEGIIDDVALAHPDFAAISLRYFNPVGAHPSGTLGETPGGCRTTCSPTSRRPPPACASGSGSSATTTPPATAPASATTSTSSTSPRAMSRRSSICCGARMSGDATGRSTSAAAGARACSRRSPPFAARPVPTSPSRWLPGGPATCPKSWLTRASPSALLGWRARRGLAQMCADHWAFQQRRMRELG